MNQKICAERVKEQHTDWQSIYILNLVGFLTSMHLGSVNLWAYISELDSTITPTFYGYLLSLASCGHMITTMLSGYFSNVISCSTPFLIAGKVTSIISSLCFLCIELFTDDLRPFLLLVNVCHGLSMGFMSVARAQTSSLSTEADRPRAVSFLSLSFTLGFVIGPINYPRTILVLSSIFTLVPYPGFKFLFGLHLNLYTISTYLMLPCGVIALVLLGSSRFNGKLTKAPVEVKATVELKGVRKTKEHQAKYDSLAVLICCLTRIPLGLIMVYIHTISGPYLMASFRWHSETYMQFVFIIRIVHGCTGIILSLSSIFGYMQKVLTPRLGITIAIFSQLLFFLITYPWPFLSNRMTYEVLGVNAFNQTVVIEPGCKRSMEWCEFTPAINIVIYCITEIICLGVSLPMIILNLEILYSTLLGDIKQGTMQSIFLVSGELLNILGPVLLASLYENKGPALVWLVIISSFSFVFALWIVFYPRMVSYSMMVQRRAARLAT